MNRSELLKSFYSAAGLLNEPLWSMLGGLEDEVRLTCEEIRLRVDRPLTLVCGERTITPAPGQIVRPADLEETLRRCTGDSVHTYLPQLSRGFATARGGHRFGICGEAVRTGERMTSLRCVSSLNIRIARPITGLGDPLTAWLLERPAASLLIVSPPGAGKTTLLRDLARGLSLKRRTALADTRYELAGVTDGRPRFRIGNCDVLSGAEPAEALEMLTRTMSPEYLVMDEITGRRELEALEQAAFSGVSLLASCHAAGPEELQSRRLYRDIIEWGLFPLLVFIRRQGSLRSYLLYEEVPHGTAGSLPADAVSLHGRVYRPAAVFCPEPVLG